LPAAEALLNYKRINFSAPSSSSSSRNYCSSSSGSNMQMRLNPTSFSGTDYTITEFPRPALRKVPNAPIADFDESFEAKCQEMIGMMYEAKGVGMAAPQIGLNENFFVYNPSGDENTKNMERIVCNPTISKYSKEVEIEEEGCLSLRSDDCAGQVARSIWIEAQYQNEMGQQVRRRLKGFEARVFQHEYDHLKGILCYDRFPPEDREAAQANIDKLLGLYTEDDAQLEPDAEEAKAMQPRPLTARHMPPLELERDEEETQSDKKQKGTKAKGGFGGGGMGKAAGGFGAGGGKKTGKKKEKKKKVKVRNGNFSSNPTFK
jgi:peptide deformylase